MTNYTRLRLSLFAAVCLIAGCIPPPGAYPQEPPQSSYPEERGYEGEGEAGGNLNLWLCKAAGSVGTAYGDEPWTYSTETGYGDAPTHDDAYLQALENCNALVSTSASLAEASGVARIGGTCSVVECTGPGQ